MFEKKKDQKHGLWNFAFADKPWNSIFMSVREKFCARDPTPWPWEKHFRTRMILSQAISISTISQIRTVDKRKISSYLWLGSSVSQLQVFGQDGTVLFWCMVIVVAKFPGLYPLPDSACYLLEPTKYRTRLSGYVISLHSCNLTRPYGQKPSQCFPFSTDLLLSGMWGHALLVVEPLLHPDGHYQGILTRSKIHKRGSSSGTPMEVPRYTRVMRTHKRP